METQSNKLDFNGQNIYVGFDVHLKSWSVTVMTEKLTHKTFSQPPKPDLLHQYLVRNFPGGTYHSAYEAGFSGYWIHNRLKALGINSIVVNPADIPTTDKEKVQKEDSRDSRKIARCLRSGNLTAIYTPSSKTLSDRSLIRTRATLVKDLARNKNRIKSFLHFHGIEIPESFNKTWSGYFIKWLENVDISEPSAKSSLNSIILAVKNLRQSVLGITREINAVSQNESYKKELELLKSIPGIGMLTAMTILTELETINRFKSFDKLCGFIGLVPSTHSSGENNNTSGITPRGHSILRSTLIESAWIATRLDPAMTLAYYGYCKRMVPNRAIIRIAKKLLRRIRYVLNNKQTYTKAVVK